MTFLYPLGFLGLIGVPVLIAIYIIKNKYTEQVISSTYLWTLSERFLKKRLPINKLVGIISLILQILAVIFISLSVAHPMVILKGGANDYLFIIDGSGSMAFEQDGKTRLDIAKEKVISEIDGSADGSMYSFMFVGDTVQTYNEIASKDSAIKILNGIDGSCTASGFADVLESAQKFFNDNPSVLTYLYTDKDIEEQSNVNVVKIGEAVENYALSEISYAFEDGNLSVSGAAVSYENDAKLTVNVYIDGSQTAVNSVEVETVKLEKAPFTLDCGKVNFRTLKVEIADGDALKMDNSVVVFNEEYENSYNVLIVSEQPTFLRGLLSSFAEAEVEVVLPKNYKGGDGYDLCVFDSFTPETVPENAALWFFNPSVSVAKSGFTVQDEVTLQMGEAVRYSKSTAADVRKLLDPFGINSDDTAAHIKKYKKCGFYRKFLTLMSCGDVPVIFTGTNEYGNREAVFAFDLHDSEYALTLDFILLTNNLLDYFFPKVLEGASFVCGDTLRINMLSNSTGVRITYPSGEVSPPLYTSDSVYEFRLTEVGTYTVTSSFRDGTSKSFNLYSSFPEEESVPVAEAQSFVILGVAGNEKRDGTYDNLLIILFILLAVIYLADWGVYCYEQYQLR